jgi:hypothetical protein
MPQGNKTGGQIRGGFGDVLAAVGAALPQDVGDSGAPAPCSRDRPEENRLSLNA